MGSKIFDELHSLSDWLLNVEAKIRDAVTRVQLDLANGKLSEYATRESRSEAFDYLRDIRYVEANYNTVVRTVREAGLDGREIDEATGELERVAQELSNITSAGEKVLREVTKYYGCSSINTSVDQPSIVANCSGGSCTTIPHSALEIVKSAYYRGGEVARSAFRALRTLRDVTGNTSDGTNDILAERINSAELAMWGLTIHKENISLYPDTARWAEYESARAFAEATEEAKQALEHICESTSKIERLYIDLKQASAEKLSSSIKALEEYARVACDLKDLMPMVAVLDRESGCFSVSLGVRASEKYVEAFRRARALTGRPVGWFIPNWDRKEDLNPTAVMNDVASFIHVYAEELRKVTSNDRMEGHCILGEGDKLVEEVCREWSRAVDEFMSDYAEEDYPRLFGYVTGKRLYMRVGSMAEHSTVVERLNGKARVEYYDFDRDVREEMSGLLSEFAGCACEDLPTAGKLECTCPLSNEDHARRIGAVVARATSMDIRFMKRGRETQRKAEREKLKALLGDRLVTVSAH